MTGRHLAGKPALEEGASSLPTPDFTLLCKRPSLSSDCKVLERERVLVPLGTLTQHGLGRVGRPSANVFKLKMVQEPCVRSNHELRWEY